MVDLRNYDISEYTKKRFCMGIVPLKESYNNHT